MNRIFAFFTAVAACVALCNITQAQEIKFKDTDHDFGNIQLRDSAVYQFEFTNTGNQPLIISKVNSSCGCTVPTYPKEPIAKGGKGVITVKYLYTDRLITFNKQVTVHSNAQKNNMVNLYIKGVVVYDKAKADAEDKNAKKE